MTEETKAYNVRKMPVALHLEAKSMAALLGVTLEAFIIDALRIRVNLDEEARLVPADYVGLVDCREVADRIYETEEEIIFVGGKDYAIAWPRRKDN